jgi:hypothetical protein
MVIVFVIVHNVDGFKPRRWIVKGDKNFQHVFVRSGSKSGGCKMLWHVKKSLRKCEQKFFANPNSALSLPLFSACY